MLELLGVTTSFGGMREERRPIGRAEYVVAGRKRIGLNGSRAVKDRMAGCLRKEPQGVVAVAILPDSRQGLRFWHLSWVGTRKCCAHHGCIEVGLPKRAAIIWC